MLGIVHEEHTTGEAVMRITVCAFALLLFLQYGALAYTFHVYSDASIQDSIDATSAGDSVVVHQGTYEESISLVDSITVCSAGMGLLASMVATQRRPF
jgi:hypothetical protein